VVVEMKDADGATHRVQVPVQVWGASDHYTLDVPGHVVSVTIDPDGIYPDVNRGNNAWSVGRGQ
ncbi:MAG: hypothetical protein P8099_06460, partial [Gemmatimonadota bacterium]